MIIIMAGAVDFSERVARRLGVIPLHKRQLPREFEVVAALPVIISTYNYTGFFLNPPNGSWEMLNLNLQLH